MGSVWVLRALEGAAEGNAATEQAAGLGEALVELAVGVDGAVGEEKLLVAGVRLADVASAWDSGADEVVTVLEVIDEVWVEEFGVEGGWVSGAGVEVGGEAVGGSFVGCGLDGAAAGVAADNLAPKTSGERDRADALVLTLSMKPATSWRSLRKTR